MADPNPHGANGVTSDPREQRCWDIYVAKLTNGKENATESALEAGYSKDHARNITLQGWFKERLDKLRRRDMLSKAEQVLKKTLDYNAEDKEGNPKVDLLRVQSDVAKHVTKTLGKEAYSERQELTGANGENLQFTIVNYADIIAEGEK